MGNNHLFALISFEDALAAAAAEQALLLEARLAEIRSVATSNLSQSITSELIGQATTTVIHRVLKSLSDARSAELAIQEEENLKQKILVEEKERLNWQVC